MVEGFDGRLGAAEDEERETVFLVAGSEAGTEVGGLYDDEEPSLGSLGGRPETRGGGSSRPSTALRESWRAKSEACHHSKNFSAKIEVGSRTLRLERMRG